MAEGIKYPRDISNKERDNRTDDRNAIKDSAAKLIFRPTVQPQQHMDTPERILLFLGQAPFDPSTIQRWINTFE